MSDDDKPKGATGTFWDEVWGGGLLDGAVSLIYGAPGTGKTTLALQVSAALARVGRKVFYVAADQAPDVVVDSLERVGGEDVRDKILTARAPTVAAAKRGDVVVLDPIPANTDLWGLCDSLKRTGVTVLILDHGGKSEDEAELHDKQHRVDVFLTLKCDENFDGVRVLKVWKNRYGPQSEVRLELTGHGFEREPSSPPSVEEALEYLSTARHAIKWVVNHAPRNNEHDMAHAEFALHLIAQARRSLGWKPGGAT